MTSFSHALRALILPGLFVLGVIAVRVPVMLAHLDSWYPFEIFSGNVAAALLDGVSLDVPHLYIIAHIRGGALFGVLAAPLYWALGSSTLAMKLVPLLWNALAVGLLVAVVRKHFSRRGAIAVGLVFLLPSPLFAKLSTMVFASHMESALLTLVALHLFFSMTIQGQWGRGRFALFGLVLGLSASFHMQSLMAGLIMAGLLVLAQPRRCLAGVLPALLCAAIGAAPTQLFAGGDAHIGTALFGTRPSTVRAVGDGGAMLYTGIDNKLKAALNEGMAPLLEFGELGPSAGPSAAHLYSALLAVGCLLLLWRERRGLLALPGRLLPGDQASLSPVTFFVLHALAVGVLFILSIMPLESWFVGTGMNGRRLVPMIFSVMIMGALGLVPKDEAEPMSWFGKGALATLCLLGAWGSWASGQSTEASRMEQRGECYEWFVAQITHETGNDLPAGFDLLAEIDHGDWRFATLRYRLPSTLPLKAKLAARLRWALQDDGRPELTLLRLTLLGRQLGMTPKALPALAGSDEFQVLPAEQRAALFHGVGLGTPHPRPVTDKTLGVVPPVLRQLLVSTEGQNRVAALEGFGFEMGFVFEPYNEQLVRRVIELDALDQNSIRALCRGFGWGCRQRYVDPPERVPVGLRAADIVPEAGRVAFVAGFTGERLPAEAAVLGATGG